MNMLKPSEYKSYAILGSLKYSSDKFTEPHK
jgi:hypothetical protein